MSYPLIDSHIHLDDPQLFSHLPSLLGEAKAVGVKGWILPSTTVASFESILQLAKKESHIYPALGLHPYFMKSHQEEDLGHLRRYIEKYREHLVAIGECGLDLMIANPQFEKQLTFFKAHVRLASEFALPLIIHSRKSLDLVLKELRKYKTLRGEIHSFSGSWQQAEQLIALGFKLGFGGAVTYPRAKRLRRILKDLPKESYLIETDAPSQPHARLEKGAIHHPKDLYIIAQEIATIRETSLEDVIKENFMNVIELFQLPFSLSTHYRCD